MNLREAIQRCTDDPGLGFFLPESEPGDRLFIDSSYFDHRRLALFDAQTSRIAWVTIYQADVGRTDWRLDILGSRLLAILDLAYFCPDLAIREYRPTGQWETSGHPFIWKGRI